MGGRGGGVAKVRNGVRGVRSDSSGASDNISVGLTVVSH